MSTNLFSIKKPNRALKTSYNESPDAAIGKDKWERVDAAKLVSDFEMRDQTISQRDFADMADIPRSTLRYWLARKNSIDAHPVLIEFFENPVGIAFLHRLVTAAHVSFTKNGTAGIHNISDFLDKSGLSPFVASSYSSQRRVSKQLDDNIIQFGEIEDKRLGQQMPTKTITLCEDETFHPEICFVAIEPVSNFILVEKYAMDRKTKTWDEAVSDALENLPVEVIQVASDEGRSLISHALKRLNESIQGHKRFYGFIEPDRQFAAFDEHLTQRIREFISKFGQKGVFSSKTAIADFVSRIEFYQRKDPKEKKAFAKKLSSDVYSVIVKAATAKQTAGGREKGRLPSVYFNLLASYEAVGD